jgi:uncharacterized protein YqeY
MALSEQIQADLTAAMKARDRETVATLRLVVAAIRNARVEAGRSGDVSDAETTDLLAREAPTPTPRPVGTTWPTGSSASSR